MRFGPKLIKGKRRRRHRKASDREAKKRYRRRYYGDVYGDEVRDQNSGVVNSAKTSARGKTVKVELSGALCLLTNTESTLRQLAKLVDASANKSATVYVNLENIVDIDSAALLVLASRVQILSSRHKVCGSWPIAVKAREVLEDAGFDTFLGIPSSNVRNGNVKLIVGTRKRHEQTNPEFALQIKAFLEKKHPSLSVEERDYLGIAVIELLENVRVHAFQDKRPSWYAVGIFSEETQTSTISILDLGQGVSATIRKKVALDFLRFLNSDAEDVEEAIMGHRTRTGERHRGKGFGTLREFVEESPGRELTVVSGKGLVLWGSGGLQKRQHIPRLRGTVVTLTVQNRG